MHTLPILICPISNKPCVGKCSKYGTSTNCPPLIVLAIIVGACRVQSHNYLKAEHGLKSWLLTVDHKRIALLYLISVSFFFARGEFLAMAIRMELGTPDADLVSYDTYNKLFSLHGITIVFFVLIPAIPAVIGNFALPMILGVKDLAFPRINLLSWYCYVAADILLMVCLLQGGFDTGWTVHYAP